MSKQNARHGAEVSYNLAEGCSFPPLNEVSNVPTFAALKMRFNESSFADDRNSSLGILQMENFSGKHILCFIFTALYLIILPSKSLFLIAHSV